MPKSKSSYGLTINTKNTDGIKLAISSPKVAKEIIDQLKAQKITASATLITTKTLSTSDK